ncbi:hypothetical protein VI26_06355 [Chromobacterium sp. LK1]|uniref:hypothetical protein n=1 Tax=Chromobacterium sp. LK1 TaxID=1628193 RepID=UPI0006536150|nr:hypothetical protein [Chromobacterium sp. LK1]KMN36465.1 hypothetical protein VI26_06355 [Chromobacterium sp. LK1]
MKIVFQNYFIDVFSIYWIDGKTFFLGLPAGHGGLISYESSQVEVVDATLAGRLVFCELNQIKGVYHWSMIEEQLLDDLLESDEDAYRRFLEIIKEEGLIDAGFC